MDCAARMHGLLGDIGLKAVRFLAPRRPEARRFSGQMAAHVVAPLPVSTSSQHIVRNESDRSTTACCGEAVPGGGIGGESDGVPMPPAWSTIGRLCYHHEFSRGGSTSQAIAATHSAQLHGVKAHSLRWWHPSLAACVVPLLSVVEGITPGHGNVYYNFPLTSMASLASVGDKSTNSLTCPNVGKVGFG